MAKYEYYVNLDERGEFNADVRNTKGDTVYSIDCVEDMEDMVSFGFMHHNKDIAGLQDHLKSLGIMNKDDTLVKAN